jgi:hypothetical protein
VSAQVLVLFWRFRKAARELCVLPEVGLLAPLLLLTAEAKGVDAGICMPMLEKGTLAAAAAAAAAAAW